MLDEIFCPSFETGTERAGQFTQLYTHVGTHLPNSTVNCIKHFFAVRVLRIWNALPEKVVSADHLTLFVRTLKHINLKQFLIGNV